MLSTAPPCVYTVIGVPDAALFTSVHACPVPVLSIVIGYSVPSVVTASQKRRASFAVEFLSLVVAVTSHSLYCPVAAISSNFTLKLISISVPVYILPTFAVITVFPASLVLMVGSASTEPLLYPVSSPVYWKPPITTSGSCAGTIPWGSTSSKLIYSDFAPISPTY